MNLRIPLYVAVIAAFFTHTNSIVAQDAENISVCIVDPGAPSGFRAQEAKVRGGRDTVVTVGTAERSIREALAPFPLARNAEWYITGKPLVIGTGPSSLRLFTYGSAKVLTSDTLVPIGFVRGMPLYADRREAALLIEEFEATHPNVSTRELGYIYDANPSARARMNRIKLFYAPVFAVGCLFQAVIRGEDIRS